MNKHLHHITWLLALILGGMPQLHAADGEGEGNEGDNTQETVIKNVYLMAYDETTGEGFKDTDLLRWIDWWYMAGDGAKEADDRIVDKRVFDTESGKWYLPASLVETITALELKHGENIGSLEDLKMFPNLEIIQFDDNHISSIDFLKDLPKIKRVSLNKNAIERVDLSAANLGDVAAQIEYLELNNNKLTSIDVSEMTNLQLLYVGNQLDPVLTNENNFSTSGLNTDNNPNLWDLDCKRCGLTDANFSVKNNPALAYLNCSENEITALDLTPNTKLVTLYCDHLDGCTAHDKETQRLQTLDVTACNDISRVNVNNNNLSEIDLTGKKNMGELQCVNNPGITKLDLRDATDNENGLIIVCEKCNLTGDEGLLFSTNVVEIKTRENPNLTALNLDNCSKLKLLWCPFTTIETLDFTDCDAIENIDCGSNGVLHNPDEVTNLGLTGKQNLKTLDYDSAPNVDYIDVTENPALERLRCGNNPQITEVDVTENEKLKSLVCENCNISGKLDTSKNPLLEILTCWGNNTITSIPVEDNPALRILECAYNALTELKVDDLTKLEKVSCEGNEIARLSVAKAGEKLKELLVWDNQLYALDVTKNVNLERFLCQNNHLNSLDLSKNTALKEDVVKNEYRWVFDEEQQKDVWKEVEVRERFFNADNNGRTIIAHHAKSNILNKDFYYFRINDASGNVKDEMLVGDRINETAYNATPQGDNDDYFALTLVDRGSWTNAEEFAGSAQDQSWNNGGSAPRRAQGDRSDFTEGLLEKYVWGEILVLDEENRHVTYTHDSGDTRWGDNGYLEFYLDWELSDVSTSIDEVPAAHNADEVVSVKYVNVAGLTADKPFDGVNMVITTYTDGTSVVTKALH